MNTEEFIQTTKELCEKINATIPCESQQDIDKLTEALEAYFSLPMTPRQQIYWDREIFIDFGGDEPPVRLFIFSNMMYAEPSDNMEEHPGFVIKYKQKKANQMYVLLKTLGDDPAVVMAVSNSKEALREKIRENAREILEDYYLDSGNKKGEQRLAEQLESLNALTGDEWDDGDSQDLLAYVIKEAPVIG